MKTVTDLPHAVRHIENVWIPMPDGARLAGRLWLPEGAESDPVPAILEYIPYRKRDRKRVRDQTMHHYFAGHGYACIRVDMRGSGSSDGVLKDEYLQQELDDGVHVIRWLGQQDWCDGNVGMIGISWGGFNGLQIAALRPPELKAVVSVCSTDDRYADDVHYMGGCLLGDNLSWASTMFSRNSLPPDPEIAGDRWREIWHDRLEHSGHWLVNWLQHQRRDHFWKHGSICENWSDVQIPVMAVSGWADGYSNSVFRILEHLEAPSMGLVGPWSHIYPHEGKPGPPIGFLQECLRWWDHWMKGEDTGITEEPALRAYELDSMPPFTAYETREGRWVGEQRWPSTNVEHQPWTLSMRSLRPGIHDLDEEEVYTLQSPLRTGLFAGKWCSYSAPPDLPGDQRDEDGGALVFETETLEEDLHILGRPHVDLTFSVNRPVAQVAVRLSDVLPDNKATRVTFGLLNLTHRNGHESPEPLEPGKRYTVRVKMNEIAQRFPAGHKLRLSISTSYWPMAWPPPKLVEMKVAGGSVLHLPVRVPQPGDERIRFEPPEGAPPGNTTQLQPGEQGWHISRDLVDDSSVLTVIKDEGTVRLDDIGTILSTRNEEHYRVRDDDLHSLEGETIWDATMERDGWHIRTYARTTLTSDEENFYVHATLDAWEHGRRVFSKIWDEAIPRDLV